MTDTTGEFPVDLRDLGKERVKSSLPSLRTPEISPPVANEERFAEHPDKDSMTSLYTKRVATKVLSNENEIALIAKNHPYTMEPYDVMVQLFDQRPVATLPELAETDREEAMEYLGMVVKTEEAMRKMVGDEVFVIISTNCAPYAKFSSRHNVQSLRTPHTHITAITPTEAQRMTPVTSYADKIDRRIYAASHEPINLLYQSIMRDLLPGLLVDANGKVFDEIGADKYTPLAFSDKVDEFPYGFSFSVKNGINDIAQPEFLQKLVVFNKAIETIYNDLASVFIANPEDIKKVGNKADESVPLKTNTPEDQRKKLRLFIEKYQSRLKPETIKQLQEVVRLVNLLIKDTEPVGTFLRGYAYSIVIYREAEQNSSLQRVWRVGLPVFLFGGGGVEAIGIQKERVFETDPRHPSLVEEYISHQEQRAAFYNDLVAYLHELDKDISPVSYPS